VGGFRSFNTARRTICGWKRCCDCARASALPACGPFASRAGCWRSTSDFNKLTKLGTEAVLTFPAAFGTACDRPT
jgi:hypothetical protein